MPSPEPMLQPIEAVRKPATATGLASPSEPNTPAGGASAAEMPAPIASPRTGRLSDDEVRAEAKIQFGLGELSKGICILVERAGELAKKGEFGTAIEVFTDARDALVARQDWPRLNGAIQNMLGKLAEERASYRRAIQRTAPENGIKLFAFADSLGLPRAEEAALPDGGVMGTYCSMIQERSKDRKDGRRIQTWAECQRYFTTDDVVKRMVELRSSLTDGLVLIHVGLNDCASRIFSEPERVGVGLLDEQARNLLLEFVRVNRRQIIHRNPEYTYVPIIRFVENLEKLVKLSRASGARHIAFVNIVQPGLAAERHTPHMRWNFTRYNMAIYDVAKRFSAYVVDADRLCWSRGLDRTLNKDGMHLAAPGHELVADGYLALVENVLLRVESQSGH